MVRAALATLLSLSLCAAACEGEPDLGPGSGADGERVGSRSEELTTVTPGPNHVEGIDVSHFQGTINWASEKAKGRKFGVASVGDGTYQDPTFATNWAAMKAAGVIRGAYQYFEPAGDPIVQADILIKKVGELGDGDLPATIDVTASTYRCRSVCATARRIRCSRMARTAQRRPSSRAHPDRSRAPRLLRP